MVLTTKGQVFFFTLMLGIVIVLLALAFAGALRETVDTAMAPSTNESVGLDCTNTSISDFDKANCIMVDASQSYFFWGMLALAGIVIGAKVIIG